ncbi:MAG: V-type ATPase subunit [Clostridia bacterium]|nr:V-type ATPase subunit [Clostridia bacterium]
MKETDYAYAVARVRSNENSFLSRQELDSLLAAPDCETCLSRLSGKGWGEPGTTVSDEGVIIDAQLKKLWSFIDEISPDRAVFDSLRIPNDYHNLKAVIKAFINGERPDRFIIRPYTVEPDTIVEAIKERNYSLLPAHMREPAEKAFYTLLEQRKGQLCDIIIDRASLEAALENAKQYGGILRQLAELNILKANINSAGRCAAQKKPANFIEKVFAEGCAKPDTASLRAAALAGTDSIIELLHTVDPKLEQALQEDGIEGFDKACDDMSIRILSRSRYTPLGIEPLVAYIVAAENEIRNIRLILTAKRNGISAERISGMLRDVF